MTRPQLTVRVLSVLCADDDGSEGAAQALDPDDVAGYFDGVNHFFEGAGIRFRMLPTDVLMTDRTILNRDFVIPGSVSLASDARPVTSAQESAWKAEVDSARNDYARSLTGYLVVFFKRGTRLVKVGPGLWRDEPWGGGQSWSNLSWVGMPQNIDDPVLFPHEVGHHFHLPHTATDHATLTAAEKATLEKGWQGDPAAREYVRDLLLPRAAQAMVAAVTSGAFAVADADRLFDLDADAVGDTPPDPGPQLMVALGHDADDSAVQVEATMPGAGPTRYTFCPDRHNLMSYYFRNSLQPKRFTAGQQERMRWAVEEPRKHLLADEIPPQPFLIAGTDTWPSEITAMCGITRMGDTPLLATYHRGSGRLHLNQLRGRSVSTASGHDVGDWTHMTVLESGLARALQLYNVETGAVQWRPVTAQGTVLENGATGGWAAGWSTVTSLGVSGWNRDHVLVHSRADGTVRLDRVLDGGLGTANVWAGSWSAGWTSIVPFQIGGSQWRVLVYDAATGHVRVDEVVGAGIGTRLVWEDTWSTGWSHVMPYPVTAFTSSARAMFLVFRAGDGAAHFDTIDDHGMTIVREATFDTGWTHLTPVFLGDQFEGARGMVAYAGGTGLVHVDRLL